MIVVVVWDHITRCKVDPICGFTLTDLLELCNSIGFGVVEEACHRSVIIGCRIWKAKNEKVFEAKEVEIEEIIRGIKSFRFLWYKQMS